MIKCDKGKIEMIGEFEQIGAEITLIIFKLLKEKEIFGEKFVNKIFKTAKEEYKKECKKHE